MIVESIDMWAFYDCIYLINIKIPDTISSIGSSAFANCVNLINMVIPNGVTKINSYTFYNCENVIEITSVGKNMGTEVAIYIPTAQKENGNV